MGKFTLL